MLRRRLLLATILAVAVAVDGDAQRPVDAGNSGVGARAARTNALTSLPADALPASQAAATKEPIIAGVLSWIIPGLGSHYAGHSKHGWTHLAVAGVSVAVLIVGVSDCVDEIYNEETCESGLGLAAVGYLGLVVNSIWGIVTAINDANAYNKRGGPVASRQLMGDLYIEPNVRALKTHGPVPGVPQTRTGVQLLSWKY